MKLALLLLLVGLAAVVRASFPMGSLQGHFTFSELQQWIKEQVEKNPQICKLLTIGHSVENRPIDAICLGVGEACFNGNHTSQEVLYTALHHAREPLGMTSLVAFISDLLTKHRNGDVEVRYLLQRTALYFVLVVNPDGYVANELTTTKKRMRRKNMGPYCNDSFVQLRNDQESGVDLNRNYAVCFDQDEIGSSRNACDIDYQGPYAFSEPETQAMRDFVLQRNFKVAFNYHSFGKQIYLPFSCESKGKTRNDAYILMYAKALTRTNGYQYGQPWSSGLYSVNGDASDWMFATRGIIAVSPEVAPMDPVPSERAGFWVADNVVHVLAKETLDMNYLGAWAAGVMFDVQLRSGQQQQLEVRNLGLLQSTGQVSIALENGTVMVNDLGIKGERAHVLIINTQTVVGVRDDVTCAVFAKHESKAYFQAKFRGPANAESCLRMFVAKSAVMPKFVYLVLVGSALLTVGVCFCWMFIKYRTRRVSQKEFEAIPMGEEEEA